MITEAYIVRPVDFTGCDPAIASQIKELRRIKCVVWKDVSKEDMKEVYIIAYENGQYVAEDGSTFFYATPMLSRRTSALYVKKASSIVRWLEENDYTVDNHGSWFHMVPPAICFAAGMFQHCGKRKPADGTWLDEWLEIKDAT